MVAPIKKFYKYDLILRFAQYFLFIHLLLIFLFIPLVRGMLFWYLGCYDLVMFSSLSPGYLPSFKVQHSGSKKYDNTLYVCVFMYVCVCVCIKSLIFLIFIPANNTSRHSYHMFMILVAKFHYTFFPTFLIFH